MPIMATAAVIPATIAVSPGNKVLRVQRAPLALRALSEQLVLLVRLVLLVFPDQLVPKVQLVP